MENIIYPGSETQLYVKQIFKVTYRCRFYMKQFPFDKHQCKFIMELGLAKNNSIAFHKGKSAVMYKGPSIWNQFKITSIKSKVSNDFQSTKFIFSLEFSRLYMNQILQTFLPILLLWLLSYSTLFITTEDFSDRFIGTVTALLVLVALLSSVNEDLPKTSYFNFIDLWFLWFIFNILLTTLFHIIIMRIPNNKIDANNGLLMDYKQDEVNQSLRIKINKCGIILFAFATLIFCVAYFVSSS